MALRASMTVRFVRVIGTPFANAREALTDGREAWALYNHARKNKVGLLYLQKLRDLGALGPLESEYHSQMRDYDTFLGTVTRLFGVLNSKGIACAAFKTLMPFPANLNDIDVLVLDNIAYANVVRFLLQNGYERFAGSPSSISIHDARDGGHADPNRKDPYDIDVYREIAANHIVYLDKDKLRRWVVKVRFMEEEMYTFSPEADLVMQLMHSVFPEQLYTLLHYYATLHYLAAMDNTQIENLICIAKKNRVVKALVASLLATAALHRAAYGKVPNKLAFLLSGLGVDFDNWVECRGNERVQAPMRYGLKTVAGVLLEKLSEGKAALTLTSQVVRMLNLRVAGYVLWHFVHRRRRVTY